MKKRNEKNDNIILTMIDFFIVEMCDSGTATIEEITEMFNEGKENEFRKMVREYKKLQNVTRNKANKAIIRLKKENKHLLELQKDMDKQYEKLEQESKEKLIIKNKYDFQDIVISALRYALGGRTYITKATADFIKEYPEIITERVCIVMLRDIERYINDRANGLIVDDDCDYNTWIDLQNWLFKIAKEKNLNVVSYMRR